MYRDRRQDVALEMERNQAAAKQSQVRPSNQVLLSLPPLPVQHPGDDHSTNLSQDRFTNVLITFAVTNENESFNRVVV